MFGIDVKKATTDVTVYLRVIDSTDGTPETSVAYDTAGIDLWYMREGADHVAITEATQTAAGAHSDGGFVHISDGVCRLDLPDAACAAGVDHVYYGGTVTGMIVIGGSINLVDYDPFDTVRLGLTALPNAAADAAGGLPISDAGGLDLDTQIGTDIDAILVDTGTTLQAEVDAIQAAVITNAAGVDIAADIIAIKAETATIVADTNELQTDNIPGTLSTIDGKIDAQDAIITEARLAELDAANLPADIAAIPTAAEVNAEVVDVMDTDTITLPGQEAPSNTPTITGVLGWVHKMLRNKKDNDGSTTQLYDDAGTTVDAKFTTTESGGTVTTGEIVSGP